MKALEESVRSISQDGLVWGSSTLIPVGMTLPKGIFLIIGFGIKKLQITLVVEDDKVSLEELQEQIEEFEDYVQSTDIVPSNFPNELTCFRLPWPSCKHFERNKVVLCPIYFSREWSSFIIHMHLFMVYLNS